MSFDKTAAESNRIIGDQIFDGSSGVVFNIDRLDLVLRVWNVSTPFVQHSPLFYFIWCEATLEFEFSNCCNITDRGPQKRLN